MPSVFHLPSYGDPAITAEEALVRCDGQCGTWWDYDQCHGSGDLVFCPNCWRYEHEPVPAPTEGHAWVCAGCAEELTAAPSSDGECVRCADLRGRAATWQEVAA